MSEKNDQRERDFELIRERMRHILDDQENHPRDRVAAAKVLRQTHLDEAELDSPFTMESLGFGS